MTYGGEDPLTVLLAARPAFGSSTEAGRLAELTNLVLPSGTVNWLEVGAGDGRHLAYQLERLSRGRQIRVVALEPSSSGCVPSSDDVTWLHRRVEDYEPDRRFDWINMRHCAYYLLDPVRQIERLSGWLGDQGALALTHWSRDCTLYRLHRLIHGENLETAAAGIEDLAAALVSNSQLIVSDVEYHSTELLVGRVTANPTLAAAVFELARRGRSIHLPSGTDRAKFTVQVLRDMPSAGVRRNGVVLVKNQRYWRKSS